MRAHRLILLVLRVDDPGNEIGAAWGIKEQIRILSAHQASPGENPCFLIRGPAMCLPT